MPKSREHLRQRLPFGWPRIAKQRNQQHALQPVDGYMLQPCPASASAMEQAASFLGQGIQGSDQVLAQGLDGVRVHQASSQMRARILLIKTCLHSPVAFELPAVVIVEKRVPALLHPHSRDKDSVVVNFHRQADRTALRVAVLLASLLPVLAHAASDQHPQAELAARDAENKRLTAEIINRPNPLSQQPVSRYNHFITYGQSLASAAEGWPALSTTPGYDNLMLGDAVRSASYSGPSFRAVGDVAFRPLKAVVQRKADAKIILDEAQVAELEKQAQEEGESVEVGALNMARRLYLEKHGVNSDP